MTIGDVLAVVFAVLAIGLSSWALALCAALLLPGVATRAQNGLTERPAKTLGLGALVLLAGGGASAVLLAGALKVFGWALLLALLGIALCGGAGLVKLVGERIGAQAPQASKWTQLWRGAGVLAIAGSVPPLGPFVVLPAALLVSLGMGAGALLSLRKRSPRPASALVPVAEAP